MVNSVDILEGKISASEYEKLKELVLAYPFSGYLQLLLAKAMSVIEEDLFSTRLSSFAVKVNSRAVLHDLIHVEHTIEKSSSEVKRSSEELNQKNDLELVNKEIEKQIVSNSYQLEKEEKTKEISLDIIAKDLRNSNVEGEKKVEVKKQETQKKTFTSWMQELANAPSEFHTYASDKYQKSFYSAEIMAKKSELDNTELVSETLAEIYHAQGNYEKALEYYKRLSLLIPEKSDFFAGKISEITQQNKQSNT